MAIPAKQQSARVAGNGNTEEKSADVLRLDPYERELMLLPLWKINLLEQVREEYEEIPELANDIASSVEQHPVQVAVKSAKEAQKHLDLVNFIWGSSHQLNDLQPLPGQEHHYALLVSGHRRTLAKRYIWEHGCEACLEAYGAELPGRCFARHFQDGEDLVAVYAYRRLPADLAMGMQLRENIRKNVPAHRQAHAYDQLFALMKREEPELSMAEFARRAGGVTPETISRARRYCRLPEWLRTQVEDSQSHLSYGHALELGRFQEKFGLTEKTIASEVRKILASKTTVRDYAKQINGHIQKANQGNVSLFGFDELAEYEVQEIRGVFNRRTVSVFHAYGHYLEGVEAEIASGRMGDPGELWRETSFWSSLQVMLRAIRAIRADFEAQQQSAKQQRKLSELKGAESDLVALLQSGPDQPQRVAEPSMFESE